MAIPIVDDLAGVQQHLSAQREGMAGFVNKIVAQVEDQLGQQSNGLQRMSRKINGQMRKQIKLQDAGIQQLFQPIANQVAGAIGGQREALAHLESVPAILSSQPSLTSASQSGITQPSQPGLIPQGSTGCLPCNEICDPAPGAPCPPRCPGCGSPPQQCTCRDWILENRTLRPGSITYVGALWGPNSYGVQMSVRNLATGFAPKVSWDVPGVCPNGGGPVMPRGISSGGLGQCVDHATCTVVGVSDGGLSVSFTCPSGPKCPDDLCQYLQSVTLIPPNPLTCPYPPPPPPPPPPPGGAKYSCNKSTGVCSIDPNGTYNTIADCVAACGPPPPGQRYSCQGSQCIPDPNGVYADRASCLAACVPPPPGGCCPPPIIPPCPPPPIIPPCPPTTVQNDITVEPCQTGVDNSGVIPGVGKVTLDSSGVWTADIDLSKYPGLAAAIGQALGVWQEAAVEAEAEDIEEESIKGTSTSIMVSDGLTTLTGGR